MRYTVEDTAEGFRLTTYVAPGPAHVYDEPGGHGPLEALYVQAEEAREAARARSAPLTSTPGVRSTHYSSRVDADEQRGRNE